MFKVLVAELTEHAQTEELEAALNAAAIYTKDSPSAVALVMDGTNGEALTVLHNNFVYLAGPPGD